MTEIYTYQGIEREGPFTIEAVKARYASGEISEKTLVSTTNKPMPVALMDSEIADEVIIPTEPSNEDPASEAQAPEESPAESAPQPPPFDPYAEVADELPAAFSNQTMAARLPKIPPWDLKYFRGPTDRIGALSGHNIGIELSAGTLVLGSIAIVCANLAESYPLILVGLILFFLTFCFWIWGLVSAIQIRAAAKRNGRQVYRTGLTLVWIIVVFVIVWCVVSIVVSYLQEQEKIRLQEERRRKEMERATRLWEQQYRSHWPYP